MDEGLGNSFYFFPPVFKIGFLGLMSCIISEVYSACWRVCVMGRNSFFAYFTFVLNSIVSTEAHFIL